MCVNGLSLEGLAHSDAIKILQSAQGVVDLMILRDLHSDPSSSVPRSPHHSDQHSNASGSLSPNSTHPPPTSSSPSTSSHPHQSRPRVPSQHHQSDEDSHGNMFSEVSVHTYIHMYVHKRTSKLIRLVIKNALNIEITQVSLELHTCTVNFRARATGSLLFESL